MLRRLYKCADCGVQFHEFVDNKSTPLRVDCPECTKPAPLDVAGEKAEGEERIRVMLESGKPPGVRTNVSRAVEIAQRMAEDDYGMTNLRDNLKPGDIAAMPPPPIQSAEAQAIVREFVQAGAPPEMGKELQEQAKNFWQPNPAALATAAPGAAAARADGVDPVGLLHAAGKKGILKPTYDVVSRAKMDTPA